MIGCGVATTSSCGGQSERADDGNGKARGGTASGGSSGTGAGGSAGAPKSLCQENVERGPCDAYVPSYWFDAATGVCMPFVYGGCSGNDNRFATIEECYATCGGQGERDLAACVSNVDCHEKRFVPACCSTDVRHFVAVTRPEEFVCIDDVLGCNAPCAADCDDTIDDGYVGSTCASGYCIPFDARTRNLDACFQDSDCVLRYGMECCGTDCCSEGYCSGCLEGCSGSAGPTKLVAIAYGDELTRLTCDPNRVCTSVDRCEYPEEQRAACVAGRCNVVRTAPRE